MRAKLDAVNAGSQGRLAMQRNWIGRHYRQYRKTGRLAMQAIQENWKAGNAGNAGKLEGRYGYCIILAVNPCFSPLKTRYLLWRIVMHQDAMKLKSLCFIYPCPKKRLRIDYSKPQRQIWGVPLPRCGIRIVNAGIRKIDLTSCKVCDTI